MTVELLQMILLFVLGWSPGSFLHLSVTTVELCLLPYYTVVRRVT